MWWFLASLVVSLVISFLTSKPRSTDIRPAGISEFNIPTVSEARNIAVLWGTDILKGPNVITYGNLRSEPIEESTGGGLFGGGEDVIIGYEYYLDMDFSMCWGDVDAGDFHLREIRFGDYVAWTGDRTTEGLFSVNNPNLFGGREEEGGVEGDVYLYIGTPLQTSDPYLNARLGQQPGNRRTAHLVWRGGYIGNTKFIKPVSLKASRYPNGLGLTNEHVIDDEANPACMLYEAWTNKLFGKGRPTDQVNNTSFAAAAQTLKAEGLGMSLVLDQVQDIEDTIGEILRHINASVYTDLSDGKINLTLIRDDYTIGNLPVLGDAEILDVDDYSRGSIDSIATELRLEYRDRAQEYKNRIFIQPEVGARHQLGYPKPVSLNYLGFTNPSVIGKIAKRELRPLSNTPASCTIIANRNAYDLVPGQPFKMVWSSLKILQIIMRVQEIDYGDAVDSKVRITCTEDVYALTAALFEDNPPSGWTPIQGDPLDTPEALFIDMPYFILQGASDYKMMVFATRPRGDHEGLNFFRDSGGSDRERQNVNRQKYMEPLELNQTLHGTDVEAVVLFTPSLKPKNVIEDNILTSGFNILLLENNGVQEFFGYTGFVNNGDGTYTLTGIADYRGLIDTTPLTWSAGDKIYPLDGGYAVNDLIDQQFTGGSFNYRIQGITQSDEWNIEDAGTTLHPFQINKRSNAPWPPGRFYTNGEEFPSAEVTVDMVFTWAHREKTTGTLQKQSDATGTKETNVTYTLEFRNDGGSLIRTESGLTGTSYTYTQAQIITDNGGISPLWLDVTAYAVDSGESLDSFFPQLRRINLQAIPDPEPSGSVDFQLDSTYVDSDLTDFPVALYIVGASGGTGPDDIQLGGMVRGLGPTGFKKLRIEDSLNVSQKVEVAFWDATLGRAVIYFKADLVTAASDALFNISWDNTGADNPDVGFTGEASAQAVWDSDYKAVYHLVNDPSTPSNVVDSTSNGNDMTSTDLDADDLVDEATVVKGFDFDNEFISAPDDATLDITGELTLECLIRPTDNVSASDGLVSKYWGTSNERSYALAIVDAFRLQGLISTTGSGASTTALEGLTTLSDVNLQFAAFTFQPSTSMKLWLDYAQDNILTSGVPANAYSSTSALRVGNLFDNTRKYDGFMNEARVSAVERSAAYLKATASSLLDTLIRLTP